MILTSNAQVMKLGDLSNDNIVNVTDVTLLVDIILNGYVPFSVPTTQVTMDIGGTANVAISGGYGTYEVESANPDIVTASLNNLTVTLTAVGGGETTVTEKPELCGDYYAWGEVQEKIVYDDVMYQYCTGEDNDGDGWYEDYHSDISGDYSS